MMNETGIKGGENKYGKDEITGFHKKHKYAIHRPRRIQVLFDEKPPVSQERDGYFTHTYLRYQ